LFGSAAAVARAAGADPSYVHRWPPKGGIAPEYQAKILKAANAKGLSIEEVKWGLNIRTCGCCGWPVDDEVARALSEIIEAEQDDA
jgi:hypothetical protein